MSNRLYKILDALVSDDVKFSNIGTLGAGAINGSANPDSVSVPGTGDWTQLASFTLTTGVYLVKVTVRFNANSTGTRAINISSSSAAAADVVWNTAKQNAAASNYTYVHLITTLRVTDAEEAVTFYLNGSQNSGSALTVRQRYGAICLRNEYATQSGGGGGSGGGGTSDYTELSNKPQIEGITLEGNNTFEDLGLEALTNLQIEALLAEE